MPKLTLEEIQLGLEVYEKFLLQEAYLNNDPNSLLEIKLSFKGIKDLGKKALAKFKSLATPEKTFVGLLGKLRKETGKEAKEILDFIRSKIREYEGKSLKDIQQDVIKLYSEFTGKKVDEALSDTARRIGGILALILYAAINLAPSAFASADVLAGLDNPPSIETPVNLDSGDDDPNTIGFDDAEQLIGSNLGSDIAFDFVKSGINSQGVNIDIGETGGAISFNTGEFNASQSDIDAAAQDAVDDLIDSLNGKDLTKANLDPFGLISNTPGDQDNNPSGSDTDGLDVKRLDTAKKIANKAADLLKDKYPDADIQVNDGTTNSDGVDSQKQVDKGSSDSASTQVAGFSFSGVETGDADNDAKDIVKPDVAKARLIDPKLTLEDKSRYRALLSLFLPLLIDDYEGIMEKVSIALQLEDSDFPISRGKMEKKRKELRAKENKNENDEIALKILDWSINTSKAPSGLRNNINKLDSKIALGKRQLKKALRPGEKGKNMGIAGSFKTQGNTGTSITDPTTGTDPNVKGTFTGSQVGESLKKSIMLILEAKTDFNELPNYNASKAKSNLGILVPLYASYWASEPGQTASGTTLPTGFDIEYVMKTYASSWRKFEKNYPVIKGKVKFDTYVDHTSKKLSELKLRYFIREIIQNTL